MDVENDKEFQRFKSSVVNFEDCPKIELRDYVPTKLISDQPTVLNFKRITIKVTGNEIKKGGFFFSDYAVFDVETEIPG